MVTNSGGWHLLLSCCVRLSSGCCASTGQVPPPFGEEQQKVSGRSEIPTHLMPWSPQQQRKAAEREHHHHQQQQQQCSQVAGPSSGPYAPRGSDLPEGVYQRLREVDQEQSTLTAKGVQGFSARVLDRGDYKIQGSNVVVQLVEIIKKPGQSLGLYLREGNGVDQFTGVFVSRFGENSELQRCGDIIRPGDQILAVNNVNVREMAIDDVVLMLSIPRRLLLRTSFLKSQREQLSMRPVERVERPVVVFQKPSDSDRRDSESSSAGILAKPASTAASWLGKKVRQQQQKRTERQEQREEEHSPPRQQPVRQRQPQVFQGSSATLGRASGDKRMGTSDTADAVAHTARIPPPRVQPIQPNFYSPYGTHRSFPVYPSATLGRLPSASAPLQRRQMFVPGGYGVQTQPVYPPSAARTVIGLPSSSMPVPPPHFLPNNAQMPAPPPYGSVAGPPMAAYKSNSLPRRRIQTVANNPTQLQQTLRFQPMDSQLPFYSQPPIAATSSAIPGYPPSGAFSDVDAQIGRQRRMRMMAPNGSLVGGTAAGRTVADIFSAQEYRNWASEDEDVFVAGGVRRSRRGEIARMGAGMRSNSLPPKTLMMANYLDSPQSALDFQRGSLFTHPAADGMSPAEKADILDRLHVSPLTNRRVPLRTAGPGFDVDRLSGANSLTGVLSVLIVEGRNLKVPDRQHSKQLYCVLEIDEMHRARTGLSIPEQHFQWAERFDIDVLNASNASFFIYAWHPQLRHRFCHKGDIRLMDVFLVDGLSANRMFTLNLEPRGQLLLKIAFSDMSRCFSRNRHPPECGVFGQPLTWLLQKEKVEVPLTLSRLVREIERRGLDSPGLYFLCGATERKEHLRAQFNANARETDITEGPVPDVNLLTCLTKDFLRELPEPLVPTNIYSMLLDASGVMPSTDRDGNQQLVMRIVDCLPTPNKNSLVFLMEHFRTLLAPEPHNGLTTQRLSNVFGPLLFCSFSASSIPTAPTNPVSPPIRPAYPNPTQLDTLNSQQASQALRLLLDYWPRVNSSSDSNSSGGEGNCGGNTNIANGRNNECGGGPAVSGTSSGGQATKSTPAAATMTKDEGVQASC